MFQLLDAFINTLKLFYANTPGNCTQLICKCKRVLTDPIKTCWFSFSIVEMNRKFSNYYLRNYLKKYLFATC